MTTILNTQVTLGFTVFRPETAPFAARAMAGHEVIILEEPLTPGFEEMLQGRLAIEDYLMLTEFEFPEYARQQCCTLQTLHSHGVSVLQIHPWMDELVGVHEFFVAGNTPAQIPRGGKAWKVYSREHEWSRKLLAFYTAAGKKDFKGILSAVIEFARADAEKIRDMDQDRAEAIAKVTRSSSVYVECGAIHHTMIGLLIKMLGHGRIKTVHLMEEVCKERYGVRRLIPPGDLLTFRYLVRAPENIAQETLLAARAMVYNRLMEKDETFDSVYAHPHMDAEAMVLQIINGLDTEQCRDIFGRIRHMGVRESLALVLQNSQ